MIILSCFWSTHCYTERTTDGVETGEGGVLQDYDDAATQCSNNVAR